MNVSESNLLVVLDGLGILKICGTEGYFEGITRIVPILKNGLFVSSQRVLSVWMRLRSDTSDQTDHQRIKQKRDFHLPEKQFWYNSQGSRSDASTVALASKIISAITIAASPRAL